MREKRAQHGTYSGYINLHRKRKIPPCQPCKKAGEEYMRDLKARDPEKFRRQRRQVETKSRRKYRASFSAFNNGKRWTAAELEIVARRDLTLTQKANVLGRSWSSVNWRWNAVRSGTFVEQTQERRDVNYRKRQVATRKAPNNGKHWTGVEMELLLREDLTSMQLAKMLGRTWSAVHTRRYEIQREPKLLKAASGTERPRRHHA